MSADHNKPIRFVAKPLVPAELLEAPVWLIKGVLPEGFLSLLKGLPGSFKTFTAVSMALCIATGHLWCDRRTKRSRVLYIAADDPDGPRMRGQAWVKYHAADLKNLGITLESINAVMFDQAVNLHSEEAVKIAAEDICGQDLRPDLIVWDTLFHTTLGADLTLPKDVLPVFRRARELMAKTGARSGLMVHHTPKDGKGTFGSVAIPASVDVIINSEANGPDTATLTNERMRRAPVFDPIEIKLAPVKVETLPDDEGVCEADQLAVATGAPSGVKSSKKPDDLESMEFILEGPLGNRATRTQWMTRMQEFGRGWSEANFDKKLGILKKQGRVTGGGAQGEYYSVADTPEARKPRGATTGLQNNEPRNQNSPQQKAPSTSSPKGDEGCEGAFWGPKEPSNHPHEGSEGGSPESRKEPNSVATEADPAVEAWAKMEDPESLSEMDLVANAIKQLKTKPAKV
jgi:AAA domain